MSELPPTAALESQIAAAWPIGEWNDVSVVVGVSGGADSVALLLVLAKMKAAAKFSGESSDASGQVGGLRVAHCNHGLRGAESDADQAFVVKLCRQLGVECEAGFCGPAESQRGNGLEANCRETRYDFLSRAAERCGARYLAVAHTADDQAETILHNALRGTGLAGLRGMPKARVLTPAVTLIRPMLGVRRRLVRAYLKSLGQDWREDASNADDRFTRNRLRNRLLPTIAEALAVDPCETLLRLSEQASVAHQMVECAAAELAAVAVTRSAASEFSVHCTALADADPHIVREMFVHLWREQRWPLQDMGFAQWNVLQAMASHASAEQARYVTFPGEIQVRRIGHALQIRRLG
jgi:tRNA(Ile)-lysidine synthase